MIYFTVTITIISVILSVIVWNLYTQTTKYEEIIQNYFKKEDEFVKHYEIVLKLVAEAKNNMDKVDRKGAFASDDEVGFTFKLIQSIIDTLAEKLSPKLENDEEKK